MVRVDRRAFLGAGIAGIGGLACPVQAALGAIGFTSGIASGEPSQSSVLLWTRFVPRAGGSAVVEAEISSKADFSNTSGGGSITTGPERDHSVKIVIGGLKPGKIYHYRFRGPDGSVSAVGRTRTLPEGPTPGFRLGIFSCSNLGFGWFNAYGHAAARSDLDLILHLGDYLYEYRRGKYPVAGDTAPGRVVEPADEAIALADYRLRHASYRSDADLQTLTARLPMIAMWDDHESADDAWAGGAENHTPAREGPWDVRKAAAVRAYREWMPVSDGANKSYRIGDLATLFLPETRFARSEPLALDPALAERLAGGGDVSIALAAFRDGAWQDPARTMMGMAREAWLGAGLAASRRAGIAWQLLGQQVLVGTLAMSRTTADWLARTEDPEVRAGAALRFAASQAGLPYSFDMWDGFPKARERLLESALAADAELVVLTGDSHNAWAFDLDRGGTAAGVEFAGQSVTSPGIEGTLKGLDPKTVARAVVERNRQLRWADTSLRGYMTLALSREEARCEWLFLETVRARSTRIAGRRRMRVRRGARRLS